MIVLPSQRNAQVIRDRLMNGKPPSFRSKIAAIKLRIEAIPRPSPVFHPLKFLSIEEVGRMPLWRKIALEVCEKHDVSLGDLISPRRDVPTVLARHEAMYRLRHETLMSTTQIGHCFRRDHTTCLASVKKHKWRLEQAAVAK